MAGRSKQRVRSAAWVSTVALIATTFSAPAFAGPAPMRMVDPVAADSIFISEFHYDNTGLDKDEFIEVQAPEETDLSGWSIVLYNGTNDRTSAITYGSERNLGVVGTNGVFVLEYEQDGLQNGDADGIALIDASGNVHEFLSYEGTITAGNGPAEGLESTDVGVSEPGSTPIGHSLQRIDGVWQGPLENSKGARNEAASDPGPEPDPNADVVALAKINEDWDTYKNNATVTTEGVVTALYNEGGFNGYVIQTGGTGGADVPTHSHALFVYSPQTMNNVAIGDSVRVTGKTSEYNDSRQITVNSGGLKVLTDSFAPVQPIANFVMPANQADRAAYLNMLVTPEADGYYVSDTYQLGGWGSQGGFGELLLGYGGPLIQETDVAAPGSAEFAAVQADNNARRVILDDGRSSRLAPTDKVPYRTGNSDIRTGVSLTFDEPVIVEYKFGNWRFQATGLVDGAADWLRVTGGETRTENAAPKPVGGDLKIATFNVLNYFTTLGADVPGCQSYKDRENNPLTVSGGCKPRGAWDRDNLDRQEGKIAAAINGLDADVVVLQEIENTAATTGTLANRDVALRNLVVALNEAAGPGTWKAVDSPAPVDQPDLSDQDVIRPAFVYKPAALEVAYPSQILVGSPAFHNAREPEAVAFSPVGNEDYKFTVVASHFKSKGGDCDPSPVGCFNDDRKAQATAMATFAGEYAAEAGAQDIFLAGDFNSYSEEDPIKVFNAAGFEILSNGEPSYVFDGKVGSLDHVLANASAAKKVEGMDVWRINAEESVLNEYSRYNYTVSELFEANTPFRSSDHNPAIIGFNIEAPASSGYTGLVDVLSINDFHGRLMPDRGQGGAVALACVVEDFRGANPGNVLFASGGDNVGATTFISAVQDDQPTIDVLNAIGLDVTATGNHEFDKGRDDLDTRIIPASNYSHLAANLRNLDGTHAYEPYEIITTDDGVRVAFIGGITEELHSLVIPAGIETLEITDLADEVDAVLTDLLAEDAADAYIVVVHDGSETADLSSVSGTSYGNLLDAVEGRVAAVISGHTHMKYVANVGGTWATMTGEYGANLGHLALEFEDGVLVASDAELVSLGDGDNPITCDNPVATQVAEILDEAKEVASELGSVPIGEITDDFKRAKQSDGQENRGGESTIGNFLADVHLWAGQQAGAQIAFMNPGGIRAELLYDMNPNTPGDADGVVTYEEAALIQPFANTLVTRTLTGAQVIEVLEQQWQPEGASRSFLKLGISSGLEYTYDPAAPKGERILSVTLDGEELDPAAEYLVIGNTFLLTGGDSFTAFNLGSPPVDTGRVDLNATIDWFEEFKVASPDFAQRAIGITWLTDPDAEYAEGDEVRLDTSSWLFSNDEPMPQFLTATLGGIDVGEFALDDAIVDGTDEVGRASIAFTVPAGVVVNGGIADLVLTDPVNGTTVTLALAFESVDAGGDADGDADAGGDGDGSGPGRLPDSGASVTGLLTLTALMLVMGVAIMRHRARIE